MLDLKRREFIALIGAGGLLVAVHYRRISECPSENILNPLNRL
jgi:hypothetical protein